uniref:Uncharacterized protein n=1 Tax=Anthurium amnicola TaxID=1678845 RepID=A0A1D1ZGD2_9ARAE
MPTKPKNSNSTTSINNKYNTVLAHFGIAMSVITFIIIICIVVFLYKRKLRRLTNKNDLGPITHLKNIDHEEYNSLDYYSNDYIDNKNKIGSNYSEPNDSEITDETRGNRNFFIYAKNAALMSDKKQVTRSNTYNIKNTKSLSDIKTSRKDRPRLLITRNNTTGNVDFRSNNENSPIRQISSPILQTSLVYTPSTSIYNTDRVNSLAKVASRHAPSAPIAPPVPSITSNKKYKEIIRGSPVTNSSDLTHENTNVLDTNQNENLKESKMIPVSNANDSTHKNTYFSDKFSDSSSIISIKSQDEILKETQMTSVSNATDENTNTTDAIDTDINNTTNTSSTISNNPIILPKNLSTYSIRSNSSIGSRYKRSLYLNKSSNTNSIASEPQNDNKNESTIEEKEEDSNKSTTNGYEEVLDFGEPYEKLSRETNLFQKTLYRIT